MSETNEPCQSPKRTLGILLYPPSIGAPCDCYNEVIVPIGSIFSLLKGAGRRFFARTLLASRRQLLTPVRLALEGKSILADAALLPLVSYIEDIAQQIKPIAIRIETFRRKLEILRPQIREIMEQATNAKVMATAWVKTVIKLSSKYSISIRFDNGWPVILTPGKLPDDFLNALDNYKTFKQQLSNLKDQLDNLQGSELLLDNNIKAALAESAALYNQLRVVRPAISLGDETIAAGDIFTQRDRLKNIIENLDGQIKSIDDITKSADDAISSNNIDKMSGVGDQIDNRWPNIGAKILQLLFDLLAALAVIEKISCMEDGMLDESTCECTKCPQGKQLCVPLSLGIEDLLPQPPGARMGTELNRCVDACCPGMELVPRYTSLSEVLNSVIPPCYCRCPGDYLTEKPCNKANCTDKLICAPPAPDADQVGFFGTSKYKWDADKCEWVCKDGLCTTTTLSPTTSTTSSPTTSTTSSPTTSTTVSPTTSTTSSPTTSTTVSPTTSTTSSPTTSTTNGPTTSTTSPPTTTTTPPPCNGVPCDASNPFKTYPKIPGPDGTLIPDCEAGINDKNECVCIPVEERADCGPGSIIPEGNEDSCTCVCEQIQCVKPLEFDQQAVPPNCGCKCPPCTGENAGLTPDPTNNCECGCPSGPLPVYQCARNPDNMFAPDYVCVECYSTTENQLVYNPSTCSCDCPPCPSPKVHKAPITQNGVVQNPTCECYCPENDTQCKCADLLGGTQCPAGKQYIYDITLPYKCKCVCTTILECGSLKNFDEDTCSCVCNNASSPCLSGEVRDPETCLCVKVTTTLAPNWYYQKCAYRELDCSEAWTCAQGPLEGGFATEEECQAANPDAIPCPDPICTTDDDCGDNETCYEGCCQPAITTTTIAPTSTTSSPCNQCTVTLQCIDSGSYYAWGSAQAESSQCPENVFCANQSPNSPEQGYWGCCDQPGATVNYTFDCPDCGGNPAPYGGSGPCGTTTTVPPTTTSGPTTTTAVPTTTSGPTTTTAAPECGNDADCEPFCCINGSCAECPPVEYKWYCIDC